MYQLYGGAKVQKKQWTIFRHNGPFFPEEYKPHKIPVIINGKSIILSRLAEEYITLYANYLDTEYIKNNKFKTNFFNDFKKTLGDIKVNSIDDIDMRDIKKHLDNVKERRKNLSKEEKIRIKEKNDKIQEPYKYCVIDGTQQKVGNYRIEPPGIFMGRGTHPKLGKIKKRINPEDVTINIDKNSPIPKPNVPGRWKKVIHDDNVIWLATWTDIISNKNKYVFTSMESIFKSKSDESKFDLARSLKKKAKNIRDEYYRDLDSDSQTKRQLATALYFIDNLALRVGGKKNTKEKADTVGVTSLRVEHLTFLETNVIKLDFLGKDSIRYCKKIKVHDNVYNNLKTFVYNKDKKKELFDRISNSSLNDYLESFMKGLTAKVWRTYNASNLFQKELDKVKLETILKIPESERINYLISFFNQANTSVALLCNHQKAVSGNLEKQLETFNEKIKNLNQKKKKYKDKKNKEMISKIDAKIKTLKLKKETKSKMKNVSLGTSKNNYIDPRIIFAFIKKFEIPSEKLFNKSLLTRFQWAQTVTKDFKF
jgi:DNA topoisomerase I